MQDNLDIYYVEQLRINKASFFQALVDYCVYVKANSLEGVVIDYTSFIDTFLGGLGINTENFSSIINHTEFSKYIPSFLGKLEIINGLFNCIPELRPTVIPHLGYNFLIVDEAKFAEYVLSNLEKFSSGLTETEIQTTLNKSVSKLNTISNKEILLSDIIEQRSNTKFFFYCGFNCNISSCNS